MHGFSMRANTPAFSCGFVKFGAAKMQRKCQETVTESAPDWWFAAENSANLRLIRGLPHRYETQCGDNHLESPIHPMRSEYRW